MTWPEPSAPTPGPEPLKPLRKARPDKTRAAAKQRTLNFRAEPLDAEARPGRR